TPDGAENDADDRRQRLIRTLQHNWALEMDGVDMYTALAEREVIPERKIIFQQLAEAERRHAELWARRLSEINAPVPTTHPPTSWVPGKAHATRIAQTPGGLPEIILAIEAEERRDVADYTRQLREADDEATAAILREVILDEYGQAVVLRRLYTQSSPRPA